MRSVRLVIADRRPIVLQGFVSLLGAQPDFEVVACCLDGASCLAAIRRLTPDVVLLEDGFTDVTASELLAVVDDEGLSSRLMFFTATVACGDLARAMATGACGAISMSAKPEALVESLRMEKPGADLARIGNEVNGIASFGNNVLTILTVNERTIMDHVAEGLSDSKIAQVLGVSPDIVRIQLDHARQKLGISSRTELAALALSRRYGAMSILAAAILAALEDTVDAGHTATESFMVMAANGSAEVVTIKISRKETVTGGNPARVASKDRAGAATGTSTPNGKLVDPGVAMAASSFAQAALNAPRPSSSSYSTFMIAAFGVLIYELDGAAHAAQSFDFSDGLADVFTASTASDAKELAAVAAPSFANFDGTASPATAVYDGAFAFEFARGDTIARDGSELHVGDGEADSGSDRGNTIPQGSGTVNVVAAAANEGTQRDTTQAGQDNGPNHGQWQPHLHASDNGSGAVKGQTHEASGDDLNHGQSKKALHDSDNSSGTAKGHAKHEASGDDLNHGQSQKALHNSDNGSGTAKGHAKHQAPGDDSNHGPAHRDLQTFDDGSAAGKHHAKHDPQADDLDTNKPQHDLQTASVDSANDAHSELKVKVGRKDGASSDDAGQAKSAVGTELGDSFHFKHGANNASSDILDLQQLGHGNGKAQGDGQQAAAHKGPVPVQDADAIDTSAAQHDHSGHTNHHAVHDLIV
ncbi:LuxR C-terminal-related transcriptional regulator [Bradyrhizobium sp. McL0615]|uniref:response regulator transcription factor n=1 Tax=Bradyrhizobium sp. McL0615 TaxID=3415673 RepID=UPI003CF3C550